MPRTPAVLIAPRTAPRSRPRVSALLPLLTAATLACTAKHPRPAPEDSPTPVELDALDYVPANADSIVSVSPRAYRGSWVERWFVQEEHRALLERAGSCGLELARLDRIVWAKGADDRTATVFIGARIGDLERLECVHEAFVTASEEAPFELMRRDDGAAFLDLREHGVGHIVNERALVLSSKAWSGETRLLAGGIGRRAAVGPLAPLIDEAERGRDLWFVTNNTESTDPVFPMKAAIGAASIQAGLEFDLTAVTASAENAKATADALTSMIEMMSTMLTATTDAGAQKATAPTPSLHERATVKTEGSRAHLHMTIERAPMEIIAARLAALQKQSATLDDSTHDDSTHDDSTHDDSTHDDSTHDSSPEIGHEVR